MKNLEQLIKDLQTDAQLAQAAKDSNIDPTDFKAVVAFANEHGYTVTVEELEELNMREMTPEELEKVAGGLSDEAIICGVIVGMALWALPEQLRPKA